MKVKCQIKNNNKLKLLQTELFVKEKEKAAIAGRLSLYSIFKDVLGPTAHAKRDIMMGEKNSTFLFVIDHYILEHVRTCIELA